MRVRASSPPGEAEGQAASATVDWVGTLVVAAIAAVLAVAAGAEPTGRAAVDTVLVAVSVFVVVVASSWAPWWASSGAAGIAAVVALDPTVAIVAAVGFLVGLVTAALSLDRGVVRSLVAAVAVNALIRSELEGFFGWSAIIGVSVGLVLLAVGLRGAPPPARRWGVVGVAVAGSVVVVGVVGAGVAGATVRSDLADAVADARQAISLVNAGDYAGASELLDQASAGFEAGEQRLASPLTVASRLVPGVAQNVDAGTELATAAADASSEASAALRDIDPSSLRVVGGAVDLDALRALEAPLIRVDGAIADLRATTAEVSSPWLLEPVQRELDELDAEFADAEPLLDNAIAAVGVAPDMLGADGTRRYLVLFTTPVEARGIAGFIGNFAQVDITEGRIDVSRFGRRSELDAVLAEQSAFCDGCSQELLDRYGQFGLNTGAGGAAFPTVWLNLTMPADFRNVAEPAQILYPQSGGEPIDGVVSLDPYVIEALMRYTGPIEVPELDVTVDPSTAAEFILLDQYRLAADDSEFGIDNDARTDALQTLGERVINALLSGALPEPSTLARDLGPLAAEHRLMVWTDRPAEQQMLDDVGLLGAMPDLGSDGGFSVVVANRGESKIDAFLERSTEVRIEQAADGARELVATVELHNGAPTTGWPAYVIGNGVGLPVGTSRLKVNFFGTPYLMSLQRDGEDVLVESLPERGWMGYSTDVDLAAGERTTYVARFALDAAQSTDPPAPVEWVQPLAVRVTE